MTGANAPAAPVLPPPLSNQAVMLLPLLFSDSPYKLVNFKMRLLHTSFFLVSSVIRRSRVEVAAETHCSFILAPQQYSVAALSSLCAVAHTIASPGGLDCFAPQIPEQPPLKRGQKSSFCGVKHTKEG